MNKPRFIGDVSDLPANCFGTSSLTWWGTLGFILIEGTGFILAAAAYFYLMGQVDSWPPGNDPPELLWGTLQTLGMILSIVPNMWLDRAAHEEDLRKVRIGLIVMTTIGILLLAIRAFEFTVLNCRWDGNAYGSIVWVVLGLHTTHLLTDVGDTVVLTVLMLNKKHVNQRRYVDVTEGVTYWNFVILAWLPLYAMLYWTPRLVS
jgi:cytochrome c oxidase subunit 3